MYMYIRTTRIPIYSARSTVQRRAPLSQSQPDLSDMMEAASLDSEALTNDQEEDPPMPGPRKKSRLSLPEEKRDIFTAQANWKEISIPSSSCREVESAVAGVSAIASRIISEPTRRSYTQVYNQICEYAASLDPPVKLDITKESIPPAVIISYMRVLFTGKSQPVVDSRQGLPLQRLDGQPRLGRGLSEGTFRKIYHALQTLHIHFQQQSEYKNDPVSGKHMGNSCNDSAVVRTFRGYLKMFRDPTECAKYGRKVAGPDVARIFQISDLIAMWQATRQYSTGPLIRAWTYILISCALLLRKAEAAALLLNDIEIPVDKVSGHPLVENGMPRYLFVHIRRSKTDQDGHGQRLLLRRNIKNSKLCPVATLMTWLCILRKWYGVKLPQHAVFCNLTRGRRGQPLVKEAFRKMLSSLIEKANLPASGLRTHSCRRTGAYYASWLGVPESTIKLYGRWQSTVYLTYVESADCDKREWEDVRESGEEDQIKNNFDVFGHLTTS